MLSSIIGALPLDEDDIDESSQQDLMNRMNSVTDRLRNDIRNARFDELFPDSSMSLEAITYEDSSLQFTCDQGSILKSGHCGRCFFTWV